MPRTGLAATLLALALVGCTFLPVAQSPDPTSTPSTSTTSATATPATTATLAPTHLLVPSPSTTADPTPTPSPAPTAHPTPSARLPDPAATPPAPEWLPAVPARRPSGINWQRVEEQTGLGWVAGLGPVVYSDGLYVVAGGTGSEDDIPSAAIWTSADALTWEPATLLVGDPEGSLGPSVVVPSGGFAAAGCMHGIVLSPDGSTWQGAADEDVSDACIWDLLRVGGRLVTFAMESDNDYSTPEWDHAGSAWTSLDGETWEPIPGTDAAHIAQGLMSTAMAGNDAVAFVAANEAYWLDPIDRIEVWRTSDGLSWIHVADLPESEDITQVGLAVGPQGWSAIAGRCAHDLSGECEGVGWYSADGSGWTRTPNRPFDAFTLTAIDSGFVATSGRYPSEGTGIFHEENVTGGTWTSANGITWQQHDRAGWRGRAIDAVFVLGDYLVGLGRDFNSSPFGAMWLSPIPDLAR